MLKSNILGPASVGKTHPPFRCPPGPPSAGGGYGTLSDIVLSLVETEGQDGCGTA